jgi:hypothetical protein
MTGIMPELDTGISNFNRLRCAFRLREKKCSRETDFSLPVSRDIPFPPFHSILPTISPVPLLMSCVLALFFHLHFYSSFALHTLKYIQTQSISY